MSLERTKLGDALDLFNGKKPELNEDGEFVVFGSNGTIGRSAKFNHPSSVILGRVGAYCGAVKFSSEPFWASDNTIVTRPKGGQDLKYWYYKLQTIPLRGYAGGAAQPLITHSIIKPIETEVHQEKLEQELISGVLSAYDDLIENNRRRIDLLEEAARLLYREWFVNLRFPGHEHVKMVDGSPEGWRNTNLFECVDVLSGGTPKKNEASFWGGDIPFFTPKDTGDGPYAFDTENMITEEGLKHCNSKLYKKDTLFVTARGTVGKLRLAQRPMAMNQSCYALLSKTHLDQAFLYFAVKEQVAHMKSRAVGAVFDAIVVDTFKNIPFLLPSEDIANDFSEQARNILRQIDLLSSQNRQLEKARDLLLPRLMDGRLEV